MCLEILVEIFVVPGFVRVRWCSSSSVFESDILTIHVSNEGVGVRE